MKQHLSKMLKASRSFSHHEICVKFPHLFLFFYIFVCHALLSPANLPDIETRKYEVKGYSKGSYKFTVKAYTSAGEDTGATASVMLEPQSMWNTHDSTKCWES